MRSFLMVVAVIGVAMLTRAEAQAQCPTSGVQGHRFPKLYALTHPFQAKASACESATVTTSTSYPQTLPQVVTTSVTVSLPAIPYPQGYVPPPAAPNVIQGVYYRLKTCVNGVCR